MRGTLEEQANIHCGSALGHMQEGFFFSAFQVDVEAHMVTVTVVYVGGVITEVVIK